MKKEASTPFSGSVNRNKVVPRSHEETHGRGRPAAGLRTAMDPRDTLKNPRGRLAVVRELIAAVSISAKNKLAPGPSEEWDYNFWTSVADL